MLAGVALFTSGVGVGLSAGLYIRRVTGEKRQPIVCDCGHNLSDHEPATNECNVAIEVTKYHPNGTKVGKEWASCACKRYVGPMPPDHFYLPHPIQDKTPEEK